MFSELFFQYKKLMSDASIGLALKADVIRMRPFYYGHDIRIFSAKPMGIDKWNKSKFYTLDSDVGKFKYEILDTNADDSLFSALMNISLEFPSIEIEDVYLYMLLYGKTKMKMKFIFKHDPDTLRKVFPEIENWLSGKYPDLNGKT